ncbi:hypothetical protein PS1_044240 [Malus domestica]
MMSSIVSFIWSPPSRGIEMMQPVRASTNGISSANSKSSPSLLNKGCRFSEITKIMSAGYAPRLSFPNPSNVIFVSFFHPGSTCIVTNSSS